MIIKSITGNLLDIAWRNRIAELEAQLAEAQAEITRLWQIAYNGEYTKARNWGADHEQADTYAMRVAGEKK